MEGVILEVCVDSLEGAVSAAQAGADRIELCGTLADGGVTPSAGLIDSCVRSLSVPVHVLVRPRPGDFRYSRRELRVMRRDIEMALELGAAGVAVGALGPGGEIDAGSSASLVEAAYPLPVTFHRAFDLAPDPFEALERVIDLGCARVLSAGGGASAARGATRLRRLIEAAGERIVVMPGGGIGPENAASLVGRTGAREVHASCRERPLKAGRRGRGASAALFGAAPARTDPERVRELARVLRGV